MSIINDALKKAQTKLKKTDKTPDKAPDKTQDSQEPVNVYEKMYKAREEQQKNSTLGKEKGKESAAPLRSAKKWFQTFLVIVFCLSCASGGFFFLSRYQPFQNFLRSVKKNNTPIQSHITRQAPKKQTYKSGKLVLNGTSLIDGKRVALINDEIYEAGEMIDGKKITSINLNRVELRDNEKITTLRVH